MDNFFQRILVASEKMTGEKSTRKHSADATRSHASEPRGSIGQDGSEQLSRPSEPKICGLVMPISSMGGDLDEAHWSIIRSIIVEAAGATGYDARLVSDSPSNMIIQRAIVQNLYKYPLVICDVSAKNANVMFELGLRIAFGRPTIVVKDDKTDYSFDTSPFRHIVYPRNREYIGMLKFIAELKRSIVEIDSSVVDDTHQGYLDAFAGIKDVKLTEKEVSGNEYIISALNEIKTRVESLTLSESFERMAVANIARRAISENVNSKVKLSDLDSSLDKFNDTMKEYYRKAEMIKKSSEYFKNALHPSEANSDIDGVRVYGEYVVETEEALSNALYCLASMKSEISQHSVNAGAGRYPGSISIIFNSARAKLMFDEKFYGTRSGNN